MSINLLFLQLAVVFLPGIIWARLDATYAAKIKPSDGQFVLRSFLFGITTYAVEFLVFTAIGRPFYILDIADASDRSVVSGAVFWEVLWALLIGFALSISWLYFTRFKLLTLFLQKIGATKKYGDEDVWDFLFNSPDAAVEYAHVRDHEKQLVFAGWINAFSETDKVRELVLLDVEVSDFEGTTLYKTPRLYLGLPSDNVHVEFPFEGTPSTIRGQRNPE